MMEIGQGVAHSGAAVLWDASDHTSMFRRVVGGVSWPKGGRAGFIVVVGEDLKEDHSFKTHHLRRFVELREFQGEVFLEPEPMFRAMGYLAGRLKVGRWHGLADRFDTQLCDYNRRQAEIRQPRVLLDWPRDYRKGFEYLAMLTLKRVRAQKTLHFGESELGGKLLSLPADLDGVKAADHPEVAALLYAVAGIDLVAIRAGKVSSQRRGVADATVGY